MNCRHIRECAMGGLKGSPILLLEVIHGKRTRQES